jgi:glycosyltransferase involved in cell wall biosynthesis
MGICLNMIVRNESKTLPRLFATLRGVVDYFVISDTGSTDDTIKVIRALSQQYKIPGIITEHPWVDFAHNRSIALSEAIQANIAGKHTCKWLMFIDADEELVITDEQWKQKLEEGKSYFVYKKVHGYAFKHLFLVWHPGQQWHWEGPIHNYLVNDVKKHEKVHTQMLHIIYHEFEGAKSHPFKDSKEKNLEDIRLLRIELDDTKINADNIHRFFQLAFTYKNVGDIPAAVGYMEQVAYFESTPASTKYSALVFIAKYLIREKAQTARILSYLEDAVKIDESRKEAYYYRAVLYRREGKLEEAGAILEKAESIDFTDRGYILIEEDIYNWKIKYELVFIYYKTNRLGDSVKLINQLLNFETVPEMEQGFLQTLKHRIDHISE